MAKVYNWRADLNFATGEPGLLSHGVTPSAQENWQTANAGSSMSPGQYTYWYRDSNTAWSGEFQDILSSRVALKVTQTWTASVDSRNNLTIVIQTVVDSIDRDDIRAPSGYSDTNTPGRDITLYKKDGTVIFSTTDNLVATAHNLSGTINVGSETFTIAPGDIGVVGTSLYLHNQTVGGTSYDDIWLGIQFRNPLPKDYRPGATLDTNTSIWKSHNRTNGACHVRTNSGWQECRTQGGSEGERGNPPLILTAANANSWRNQKLLGKQ